MDPRGDVLAALARAPGYLLAAPAGLRIARAGLDAARRRRGDACR
jgi:hypothetical protein